MYLLIIAPLVTNLLIILLFGLFIGKRGAILLTLFNILLSWFTTLLAWYEVVLCNVCCNLKLFNWVSLGYFNLDWGFVFDPLSVSMSFVVLTISLLVHLYTLNYMEDDPYFVRFYVYLTLFTFFMLLFTLSDNFIQMFFGWEGVGIASYLLINFWYTRLEANRAALKAIIINRVGDTSIYVALILLFILFRNFDYAVIFELCYWVSNENFTFFNYDFCILGLPNNFLLFYVNKISMVMFLFFLGAMSKSAQIGFHTWLPDAMEGPTPVSALLHAATMVTAGVYLLIRLSPLLEYCSSLLFTISMVGGLTAFFTATIGIVQTDLKKVIAYSTCSQLGYMISVCGLSGYSVALFHLFNHAFFKALLFLGAGSVIHSLLDEQDMRKMGGVAYLMPITYVSMLIASFSLMGLPFLSGFYSKDLILELTIGEYAFNGAYVFYLGVLGAFCTSFYSFRLLYLTFLRPYNGFRSLPSSIKESSPILLAAFIFLSLFSIFSGYLFRDLFVGLGSDAWSSCIFTLPSNFIQMNSENIPSLMKLLPSIFSILGLLTSFLFFINSSFFERVLARRLFFKLHSFLYNKWFFDYIYNLYIVRFFYFLSYNIFYKLVDRGFTEFFGPFGIVRLIYSFVNKLKHIYSGSIHHYVFLIIVFIIASMEFALDIVLNTYSVNSSYLEYVFPEVDLLLLNILFAFFFTSNKLTSWILIYCVEGIKLSFNYLNFFLLFIFWKLTIYLLLKGLLFAKQFIKLNYTKIHRNAPVG